MNRITVNDSEFRSIGYDPVELLMEVVFWDGRTYLYSDVPMAVYDDFISAGELGDFYSTYIENDYPCTQIR
jgi:hypothetical protein